MTTTSTPALHVVPALDSEARAAHCREVLGIPRTRAAELGRSAVAAIEQGMYRDAAGRAVDWRDAIEDAVARTQSLALEAALPHAGPPAWPQTRIEVANKTTLAAARRLSVLATVWVVVNADHITSGPQFPPPRLI